MRKAKPKKRYILPDPKFNDTLVTKFVNCLMYDGKKSIAYNIFYDAVAKVESKVGENGLEVWKKALNNIAPTVEVKSRRVGGATFQVPMEVRPERKMALGIKWMILYHDGPTGGRDHRGSKRRRSRCQEEGRYAQNG
jgi:small subunit ribosomal protein S7